VLDLYYVCVGLHFLWLHKLAIKIMTTIMSPFWILLHVCGWWRWWWQLEL